MASEICSIRASEGVDGVALEFVVAAVLGEASGVGVHAVEVGRAMNQGEFLGSESGETVSESFLHVGRVVAEVDGVGVPANVEVQSMLSGVGICG